MANPIKNLIDKILDFFVDNAEIIVPMILVIFLIAVISEFAN